jgi:transposase
MRRRFVRTLTATEEQSLRETYRAGTAADHGRRCHAVLLSAAGKAVLEIAALLQVDGSTIHRWLDRFEAGGVPALASQWGDGRPPRWDEPYEHTVVELLRHDPRWYGLEHSNWTCPLLAGYLAERTGITLSAERVRVLLHGHGLRLKQPTAVVHSRDPRYDPKG